VVTSGLVACFAGKIGSGKTSVTNALAQCLGWRRVGFGDYVRAELARRGGNPEIRAELQELGQRLVDSDPVSLCRAVLGSGGFNPGDDLLVDGIRHAAIYRVIVDLVKPSRACLFYLRASDNARGLRTAERREVASTTAESHPVEAELATTIPDMADAVVDASGSFSDTLLRCVDVLGAHGVASELIASCQEHARQMSASDTIRRF
jgi:cytidylate kinase